MKLFVFVSLLTIAGCSSTPIRYTPALSAELSTSFIEQVVYEQPIKHRPTGVVIAKNFVGFAYGISAETKSTGVAFQTSDASVIGIGNSETRLRDISERYYFNSMSSPKLFKKRDWYIVQLVDKSGRSLKNIYTRSEIKAKKFIDQIFGFIKNAS